MEVRNLHFDLGSSTPRAWHPAGQPVASFFNNLSVFFPAGERFFIAAVKAHASQVEDAALQQELRTFCHQEGIHSREHVRYNQMLLAQGYPVERMEGRIQRLLQRVSRRASPKWQLALTCALEHFTAILADVVLEDPRVLEGAHGPMGDLWRWHALEEGEHRHVAFDVYQATGGGYLRRVLAMGLVTLSFWARVAWHQVELMRVDGEALRLRAWGQLLRFLFVEPGGLATLGGPYLAYFRPSFHPRRPAGAGSPEALAS